MPDPNVTLRRSIEQVIHCLELAESVLRNCEDPRLAFHDFLRAKELMICTVEPVLSKIGGEYS